MFMEGTSVEQFIILSARHSRREVEKGRQYSLKHGVGEVKVCSHLLQPFGRNAGRSDRSEMAREDEAVTMRMKYCFGIRDQE